MPICKPGPCGPHWQIGSERASNLPKATQLVSEWQSQELNLELSLLSFKVLSLCHLALRRWANVQGAGVWPGTVPIRPLRCLWGFG